MRQADTVARLGGDEFVVLCDGLGADNALPEVTALGGKLLAALNLPYLLGTHVWHSTASIGATLFSPRSGQQAADLLMQADVAMYQAKRAGRNGMRFFDQDMQDSIDLRGERVRRLRGAIAQQQSELLFQLQLDADGRPCGAEAQLCWRQADGTLEAAPQFAGLAEEAGLLVPLGDWMLEQACAQLHRWRGLPVLSALVLSVDLGAAPWRQPDFSARVRAALARHGVDASLLCLDLPASLLGQPEHPAFDARRRALRARRRRRRLCLAAAVAALAAEPREHRPVAGRRTWRRRRRRRRGARHRRPGRRAGPGDVRGWRGNRSAARAVAAPGRAPLPGTLACAAAAAA